MNPLIISKVSPIILNGSPNYDFVTFGYLFQSQYFLLESWIML